MVYDLSCLKCLINVLTTYCNLSYLLRIPLPFDYSHSKEMDHYYVMLLL